jgi:hypothetical protein
MVFQQALHVTLLAQQEFHAQLELTDLPAGYAFLALEDLMALCQELLAQPCAKPVFLVSLALQVQQRIQSSALQVRTVWLIAAQWLVMQEFFAQPVLNLFKTTMPSVLLACIVLLALHLYVVLQVLTRL